MRTDVSSRSREFLDAEIIAQFAPIPLLSRRPMLGSVSGRHASPHRGSSVEFAEYRKYVPGDDPRRLDWRAAGRSDRFYVKEFEADTNLRCVFVVDTSGSMGLACDRATSGSLRKIELAKKITSNLAYLAVEQGDAVGVALASHEIVQQIPSKRGPAHLANILDTIAEAEPEGQTQLPTILHQLAETVPRRALIVIVSDLFFATDALRACLDHLHFRRHDTAIFHVLEREEIEFDFQRPTRFIDLEGGPSLFVDPNEIVDRYRKVVNFYLSTVQQIALETGTDYHRVWLEDSCGEVLYRFLIERVQRRGRR
jgi:uncharacterized protein (DUF58 family)